MTREAERREGCSVKRTVDLSGGEISSCCTGLSGGESSSHVYIVTNRNEHEVKMTREAERREGCSVKRTVDLSGGEISSCCTGLSGGESSSHVYIVTNRNEHEVKMTREAERREGCSVKRTVDLSGGEISSCCTGLSGGESSSHVYIVTNRNEHEVKMTREAERREGCSVKRTVDLSGGEISSCCTGLSGGESSSHVYIVTNRNEHEVKMTREAERREGCSVKRTVDLSGGEISSCCTGLSGGESSSHVYIVTNRNEHEVKMTREAERREGCSVKRTVDPV